MDWKYLFTSFEGRIGRQQWWLGTIVLVIAIWIIMFVIGLAFSTSMPPADGEMGMGAGISALGIIIMLIIYIPFIWASLALSVKRWHDRDKSGWWILINLVPIIGGLWALIENGFLKGTDGSNRFGPDPLAG